MTRNDAIIQELQVVRNIVIDALSVRAANLAGDNADLATALAEARKRIAVLEAPKEEGEKTP